MKKSIVGVILGILMISLIVGCIDLQSYTVEVTCPLDSYTYVGKTQEEAQQICDDAPFYCSCEIIPE